MQLSIKNPIHHVSVFFKKNIIQEIGCYRNIPKVEDYDLWLRLYRYSKFRNNRDAFSPQQTSCGLQHRFTRH